MSTTTIILLLEIGLRFTAKGIMIILRIRKALACGRIRVGATVLLSTCPTPRSTASMSYMKFIIMVKPTGEDIITRGVFETPPLAPWALFRIARTGLRHFFGGRKDFVVSSRRMVVILTLAIGADFRKSLAPALKTKVDYAARHGYKYIQGGEEFWDRERPIPWSKVGFVLNVLRGLPDGELVFLSDADVMITNPELRLEDLVVPLLPAQKDLLMTIDACGHLNSGNMLMRNGPWLRDWWRRVGEQKDLLYHIWWENAAMIRLLETVPADLARTETTAEHWKFNAYLQGLPGERLWEPGCFLVHFAGVYDLKRMEELQKKILGIS